MKKSFSKNARAVAAMAVMAGGVMGMSGAHAAYPVVDHGAIRSINSVGSAVSSGFRGLTGTIISQTNMIRNAVVSSGTSVMASTTEAAKMTADANTNAIAQNEINKTAGSYRLSDACGVTAVTHGMGEATRGTMAGAVTRGSGGGAVASAKASRGNAHPDQVEILEIQGQSKTPPSLEKQAYLASRGACNTFVNGGYRKVLCDEAGLGSAASSGYPDGDVRAETLFDGPQKAADASQTRRRLTVAADGNDRLALESFVRNIHTPLELSKLSATELRTDAGRQYMTMRDAYDARTSLATRPLHEWMVDMTENKDLIDVAKQMGQGESYGNYVKNELAQTYPNWEKRGISLSHLLHLEASKRYLNKDWYVFMAAQGPDVHVREQTNMMAQSLYVQTMALEELRRLNIQLGQMSVSNIREEMMPTLVQLHNAAKR